MKLLRVCGFFFLLVFLFGGLFLADAKAFTNNHCLFAPVLNPHQAIDFLLTDFSCAVADFEPSRTLADAEKTEAGGIKERIPAEFLERYNRWKQELLTTNFGREQWKHYSANKRFSLIITVSGEKRFAAKTGDYKWSENGELVGATITLGKKLDKGFPNAIYYPVMNSLSLNDPSAVISGEILAATKFAHEIGHVNVAANTNGELFERQNKLIAAFYKIYLNNGYDANDSRLIKLADELGAMPMQIWADREYWGETNAMRYLTERVEKEKFYCSVFNRIRRNINDYAKNYEDRFEQILKTNSAIICQN